MRKSPKKTIRACWKSEFWQEKANIWEEYSDVIPDLRFQMFLELVSLDDKTNSFLWNEKTFKIFEGERSYYFLTRATQFFFVKMKELDFIVRIKILSKILPIIGKFSNDSFSQFSSKPAYNWNTTVL